jgi:peptidoglycan/LPS O-acetylase OafA/YrhL
MLGQRSYSIYLMHVPLLLWFEPLAKRATNMTASALVLFAYVSALIAIAGWTYRFIEDPFRNRINRFATSIGAGARVASR